MMYPPLPPPPKKEIWKRYAAGEKLQPTYDPVWRPIPEPQMPGDRREKSGADGFEAFMFGILIFAAIVIGCAYTFTK